MLKLFAMYYTIQQRSQSNKTMQLLSVTSLDSDYWIFDNPERVRLRTDSYELILLMHASGKFLLDLQEIELRDRQLLIVRPGQVYVYPESQSILGYTITINNIMDCTGDDELNALSFRKRLQLLSSTTEVTLTPDSIEEIKVVVEKMAKEAAQLSTKSVEILKTYFNIFILYMAREMDDAKKTILNTRNAEIVDQFMNLLEKKFKEQKMVAYYATALSLTSNYLNEIVKKNTGYPVGYHIRQRIILEAKRMLFYSNTCRKEIASNLGFNDMAHFSKFFKAVSGKNFTEYKKEKQILHFDVRIAV